MKIRLSFRNIEPIAYKKCSLDSRPMENHFITSNHHHKHTKTLYDHKEA